MKKKEPKSEHEKNIKAIRKMNQKYMYVMLNRFTTIALIRKYPIFYN